MIETIGEISGKAVVVGVMTPEVSDFAMRENLDELAFLGETASLEEVGRFVQRLDHPDGSTFVGRGKLEEIAHFVAEQEVEVALFDDELTPTQQRNIERQLGIPVMDRTSLILTIFAQRARTAHAKTQVEMAQYQYLLPRLTRMWTHLERQRGGINMRGPGETQLETDRRIVLDKIAKLKAELEKIDTQKAQQRKNRGKLVRVALVGYTNVGKSTLMNLLAKSEVFAENRLFATLDTTVRKVVLHNLPFLLSDTVGFIRKLPTQLVESFKSTLDEVVESDLILHVVDLSHPYFEEQIAIVEETLGEILHGEKKPTLMVFNKIDAFTYVKKEEDDLTPKERENYSLYELQETWMAHLGEKCHFVSAVTGQGIPQLKARLYEEVKAIHIQRYPYNDFLFQDYSHLEEE